MEFFPSQNELTPKRLAFFASKQDPSRPRQPRQAERERQPANQTPEQQPERTLEHLSDSIRERIADLKAEEILSEKDQNDSPQEIVSRLKELSKASDAKIFEWYGAKYDLSGAVTQQMKDDIRTKEITRFKELVGTNAAKEVDAIIASSPKPEKYNDALQRLKSGIGALDTFGTQKLFKNLELDSKKAAKEEAIKQAKNEVDQEAIEGAAKIGFEAEQYVVLLRKKIELEQKLKEAMPKIAEVDQEIKAHKEAEATIDEKKERYIDWKRKWLMRGVKAAGYLSLAGGWLGAMGGLTGIGVGLISAATGVTDVGFFKGVGLGATWLIQMGYRAMKGIEDLTNIGMFSQIGIAALTLIPIDFGIKKLKQRSERKRYDKKQKELESKRERVLKELDIKDTEEKLSEAIAGLEKYKKINQERVKNLQGHKKHYEKVQDDLLKEIDSKRKKGKPEDVSQDDYEKEMKNLQENLETISKTILSLESFLLLFSVSEGDRAERVLSLPVLSPENILANLQAMEDKLEPQLSQSLLQLGQREQARLIEQQKEAKEVVKRETLQKELMILKNSDTRVRNFFEKVSRSEEVDSTTITSLINELELKSPRTARLIKILLHLPKTRFRKELANTVLNIIDMPEKGGDQSGGSSNAAPGAGPTPGTAPGGAQTPSDQSATGQNASDADQSQAPKGSNAPESTGNQQKNASPTPPVPQTASEPEEAPPASAQTESSISGESKLPAENKAVSETFKAAEARLNAGKKGRNN